MKNLARILCLGLTLAGSAPAAEIHVAPRGADTHPGTAAAPLKTLAAAQQAARAHARAGRGPATVLLHAGTYYLPQTLVFTAEDSGTQYRAGAGEIVVLSGGERLSLSWQPYRDGILKAKTPAGLAIDQLFVNGERQRMARYPNFDPDARPYNGYAADAFSPQRAARWSDPRGGFIHAMHRAHWGGYHYRITGKNDQGEVRYEGGWQNNRQMGMHPQHRFVENIFEELDAPGEWFHAARGIPAAGGPPAADELYYVPAPGVDLNAAAIEVVRLRHLVEFNGSRERPVKNVTLCGFVFRHAARTFMETREPLLRSDWTVYRGGAVVFHGAEDCAIADCEFDQPGGNGVFVNGYNRRVAVRGCDIHDTGASGVAFVGDPKAVRSPLFEYGQRLDYAAIDKAPGPQTEDYPAECTVEDCLIRRVGMVEKQATGVQVSMSQAITIRHCSIYEASRAGINISEGTFGGHTIEFCDVFDTVRETGDHGSFNSWGRDRYWGLTAAPAEELPNLAMLDAVKPTVIRNSRWRCDHGWDVDLDDGSSNYHIYNNLFLNGGLKLREGFHRVVRNNITVNNTLHPHVWYDHSGDVVTANIFMAAYRPAGGMPKGKWGQEIDRNLFTAEADRIRFAEHGCDAHSLAGDPKFIDPARGDFRVQDGSPALKLGFENFPMDQFGVGKAELKRQARTPEIPALDSGANGDAVSSAALPPTRWQGAKVRNLQGQEFSAFGVSRESGGVHLKDVPAGSLAANAGLRTDDLVQSVAGRPIHNIEELVRAVDAAAGQPVPLGFVRGQATQQVSLSDYAFTAWESSAAEFKNLPLCPDAARVAAITTRPAPNNERPSTLHDGKLAANYGPVFSNGVRPGMYKCDLGRPTALAEIRSWSFAQNGNRGWQRFALFGSPSSSDPGWNVSDAKAFTPIAEVDVPAPNRFLATAVRRSGGQPLGTFRWLVWVSQPVTRIGEHTAFQEFQALPAKMAKDE